jgi:DNA-binding MarR family transcriptional regulator
MSESWTFFTNHARVLFVISEDPDVRLRDVAERVGITERATQRIVAELEQCGFLEHERVGRRNRYHIVRSINLRHPVEQHIPVNALLDVFENKRAT